MERRQGEWMAPLLPRRDLLILGPLAALALGCPGPSPTEIGRDRAIEIARPHVSFTPDTVEAVRTTSDSRAVWRVTFRGRLPGQPPGLFETAVIAVDRVTGEIVSIAQT
jgi:hypothetical protein